MAVSTMTSVRDTEAIHGRGGGGGGETSPLLGVGRVPIEWYISIVSVDQEKPSVYTDTSTYLEFHFPLCFLVKCSSITVCKKITR